MSASSPNPIIEAQGITKYYGRTPALQEMDLELNAGECLGLLGPNGAGKSTFIGCLYGVVKRSAGNLRVFGRDPRTESREIKRRLGVVTQENALDEELTVRENMDIYARFGGLSRREARSRIDELLVHMALDHKGDANIKMLSGGMKRRLTFVRALLAHPELLILDEPTTGLDPSVRHLLWEKVQAFRQSGRSVLVTTHYMHEAEVLCDRILILDRGKVVRQGTPRDLIARETPGFVAIFSGEAEVQLRDRIPAEWPIFPQGQQICVRAPRLDDLLSLQESSATLARQMRPANLEDVYLKLTGRVLDDEE